MNSSQRIRLTIIGIIFGVIYSIMCVRIWWIQIAQAPFFKTLLDQQRYISLTITPPRAPIYDRSGRALVFNRQTPSLFIEPHLLSSQGHRFIAQHFPHSYSTLSHHTDKKFLWVQRSLNQELLHLVEPQLVPGMQLVYEPERSYPFIENAHILGFTDRDGQGIAGLEQLYGDHLAGISTSCTIERDARGQQGTITHIITTEGKHGEPLYTTLDSRIQWYAYHCLQESVEKLRAKLGSVVVMDPTTGEIIAMVSYPSFDPHKRGIDQTSLMKNIPVTESYELGSVIKIFTALAAFEEGVVEYDEMINCEGKRYLIDKFPVENWRSMGIMPFYDVMKHSSNVGLAKVAQRLGTKLYDHFYRLGFGRKTSLTFPGQRTGTLFHPHVWSRSTPLVMSFGYEMGATLLQLAQATSIVANGGFTVSPHIIKDEQISHQPLRLYRESSIHQIKKILALKGQQFPIPGYCVMGKTGTARILKEDGYSKENHNYTFAGIIEQGSYKRVIVTFIHDPEVKGLLADRVAAPLFQKVGTAIAVLRRFHEPSV